MVLAWFCLMPPRASQSNNQCDEQVEQSDTQRAALTQHTTANSEGCAQAAIDCTSRCIGCHGTGAAECAGYDKIVPPNSSAFQTTTSVCKRALGVPGSSSNLLALVEMGRYPMQVHWLVRCVKFWNRRVAEVDHENRRLDSSVHPTTREHSLMAQVFIANVHHGLEKHVPCW
jgi:hypothetical protein